MRRSNFYDQRQEPILLPIDTDELAACGIHDEPSGTPKHQLDERSEPFWNLDVPMLRDHGEPQQLPRNPKRRKGWKRHRMIDWLSALALLLVSAAFVSAVDRSWF